MHTVTPSSTSAHTARHEAELREAAAERCERNANAYLARGIDPWTHATNLRAVAQHYRALAARWEAAD